jgi:hypothetical protein
VRNKNFCKASIRAAAGSKEMKDAIEKIKRA